VGFASSVTAVLPEDKRVMYLPGIGDMTDFNYEMYSGYAKVSETKQLHYVLLTSQNDMATDPL